MKISDPCNKRMKEIRFFTDGASGQGKGDAGYGCMFRDINDECVALYGFMEDATNNQAELMGAASALEVFKGIPRDKTIIVTDSKYVCDGINKHIQQWVCNDWRTTTGKPVKNKNYWKRIYPLLEPLRVSAVHVHGHAGMPENECCDYLATYAKKEKKSDIIPFTDLDNLKEKLSHG